MLINLDLTYLIKICPQNKTVTSVISIYTHPYSYQIGQPVFGSLSVGVSVRPSS